jgi:molybdate/tungstate transport system substrate-binding protein
MIGLLAADTLVLFVAASLTKPLQPVLDAFTAQTGIVVQRESGASLEHVRKITDLHRVPDVLLLADADVFPRYLVPAHATWYADFARNRMVVAYTPKSKHAAEITPDNWMSILAKGEVEVGRTDPKIAPVGYRTLLMFQLAERFYQKPGLAKSLLDHAPDRNMRPNAAELAGLLAAGELDYIYDYQSVAESNGFRYVALPPAIDLGDAQREKEYESVSVDVRGPTPGSTMLLRGEPILYGMSIPRAAPHPASANRFVEYLFSPTVLKQLRDAHVDMIAHPVVHGAGAPSSIRGGDDR